MKLSVRDRLILLRVLPKEGDYLTLKIVRDLAGGLSFSEDEHKEYKFKETEGAITWSNDSEKDVEFGDKAKELIATALKALSDQKKLSLEHFDLYERFCEKAE
uniref:Uncharacterized protein n=1 Tax=viral metagenome TaxID=1070528 RepID=A0A6M3K243_9ZZZZ